MFCWDRRCVTQGCLALSLKYISIGFGEMSIPRSGDRRWKGYQRVALDSWKRRSKGTGGYATRTGSRKPLSLKPDIAVRNEQDRRVQDRVSLIAEGDLCASPLYALLLSIRNPDQKYRYVCTWSALIRCFRMEMLSMGAFFTRGFILHGIH